MEQGAELRTSEKHFGKISELVYTIFYGRICFSRLKKLIESSF
jgi:hypothetical protein